MPWLKSHLKYNVFWQRTSTLVKSHHLSEETIFCIPRTIVVSYFNKTVTMTPGQSKQHVLFYCSHDISFVLFTPYFPWTRVTCLAKLWYIDRVRNLGELFFVNLNFRVWSFKMCRKDFVAKKYFLVCLIFHIWIITPYDFCELLCFLVHIELIISKLCRWV